MVLSAIAGKTPAANSAVKGPGKPTIKYAAVKKIVPETTFQWQLKHQH